MKKYENFCNVLANLLEGLKLEEPYSAITQMGIAACFNHCFELSWKLMKETLENHGFSEDSISSPRAIIKLAFQSGMIKNQERWFAILKARNLLSHIYSGDASLETIRLIKSEYVNAFTDLKAEIDEHWIVDENM